MFFGAYKYAKTKPAHQKYQLSIDQPHNVCLDISSCSSVVVSNNTAVQISDYLKEDPATRSPRSPSARIPAMAGPCTAIQNTDPASGKVWEGVQPTDGWSALCGGG